MEKFVLTEERIQEVINSKKSKPIAESDKAIFTKLLKNEAQYLSEATFSGDIARLGTTLVPVFRRAFPQLIAKDLVGVQPMTQPTGYVFALRYSHTGNTLANRDKNTTGTEYAQDLTGGLGGSTAAFGTNNADNQRTAANTALIVYSSESARQVDTNSTDINAGATAYGTATGTLASVLATDAKAVIYTEENKALIYFGSSSELTALQALAGASGSEITDVYNNEAAYKYILKYYPGLPYSTANGEKLGYDIQELGMSIDKIAIEAQTRKLKARYTIEAAQDLKAAHGKDMANELIDILSYEITSSIDRQLIDAIDAVAPSSSFYVGSQATANNNDGRWQLEKFRNAYIELVRKSNDIAKSTLRGPGNFIIGSPDVVTMIEQMPGFTGIAPIPGTVNTNAPVNETGNAMVGNIGGRFAIYRDIFASEDSAIVGYKGSSSYDTGIVWSPYIPLAMQQTVDQESGNPSIIFMERSAISSNIFGSQNFYRKVLFSDIFA